jgi:hypothetical protein
MQSGFVSLDDLTGVRVSLDDLMPIWQQAAAKLPGAESLSVV